MDKNSQYRLGLYEKALPTELSWEERLLCAKEAGYDLLEMSVDETDEKLARLEMSAAERRTLRAAMEKTGLPIHTMCLSGHRKYPLGSQDALVRAKSMEIMAKAIELAGDLGIRLIQLAGYDVYYEESTEETKRHFAENLARAAQLAARQGVTLGFETMETQFMDTVWKAMRYVRDIRSPYLQIYPDCGNLTNAALLYRHDVSEDIRSGAGHIAAIHLKETLPGRFREVPYGTGHVDFTQVIGVAWSLGVRMYVAEFWYKGNLAWRQDLHAANGFLRDFINRATR